MNVSGWSLHVLMNVFVSHLHMAQLLSYHVVRVTGTFFILAYDL